MRRRAVLLAGLLALMTTGLASPPGWTVVRQSSTIDMQVRAFGGDHSGRFETWDGDIRFDPAAPARTRATVVVQAASLQMRPAVATRRATGPAFLDAARYPQIRFELRSLAPLADGTFTALADVSIRGRTRPVRFPVVLNVDGDLARMVGGFSLDRTDFGIGTSGPLNRFVGRQVQIRVALQIRREA